MKIGILTFHKCINYGSYWQARCLTEALQGMGYQAVLLNHQSRRVDFSEWKCALQPVLPTAVPQSDRVLYRQKIEKFLTRIDALPLSAPFPLESPAFMEHFDLIIVGSDEVWNLSHPWYGHYPIFFGEGLKTRKLIAYAGSFGNYHAEGSLDQAWVNKLNKFDKISVRDENSQCILKNTLGFKAAIVLDPCLLFPFFKDSKVTFFSKKPFAVVYGHNFSQSMIRQTLYWAKIQRISLVSIGYRNDWVDQQWITADPFEFAGSITQSAAVITNFFHGCIFALINRKPFVCEKSEYRSNKIHDLMKSIHAEKYLISEKQTDDQFEELLSNPVDEKVYEILALLRRNSEAWLKDALKD